MSHQKTVEDLQEKYDKESNYRKNIGKWGWVVTFLAIYLTCFHLYTGYYGAFQSQIQGAVHLGTALGIIFLLYPATSKLKSKPGVPWYDVVLAFTALFAGYYKIIFFDQILQGRVSGYSTFDTILSIIAIILLLEATRRTVGVPIIVVALITISYAVFGKYIPTTILSHPGFSLDKISTYLWYRESGVFGTPIQISAKFIFLFLFFGVVLVKSGIGQFFNDLALGATGRFTGGTAKSAVIASALQGMISGSSVGNTVASGSFTIPMMKKARFKPEFAAATEASASTGGQIMPPLMGAAAFIMVEYIGTTYANIMLAALVPAILYFSGIFIGTHFEAKKMGIFGMSKSELPNVKNLMVTKGYMLIPLFVIIGTIVVGFTPQRAALMGIISAYLVSMVRKENRLNLKETLEVLETGARVALPVISAVATAGIIAGVIGMTGLGTKFASAIIALSGDVLILALIFTMIACIILGMGLPTTANYVVTATIAAPALINQFGLEAIAVHLFVFYFGIVADITPPVCLAAYAGAGIARANPFKTGVTAVKLAIAAFVIPYFFIFNPIILFVDFTPVAFTIALITAIIGMVGISSSVIGFFVTKTKVWERLVLAASGIILIFSTGLMVLLGFALMIGIWVIQKHQLKEEQNVAL